MNALMPVRLFVFDDGFDSPGWFDEGQEGEALRMVNELSRADSSKIGIWSESQLQFISVEELSEAL